MPPAFRPARFAYCGTNDFGLQQPLQEPLRLLYGQIRLFRHNANNILICHHMSQAHLLWHMSGARTPH